jgi:phage baseplate assembly protein W
MSGELELFGAGVAFLLAEDGAGRLVVSDGEARLWESVEAILSCPQGTCALDPLYGLPLQAYDPIANVEDIAWAVGRAIERSEPRAQDITVEIVREERASETLWLRVRIVPIGEQRETNRIFPFYRKV